MSDLFKNCSERNSWDDLILPSLEEVKNWISAGGQPDECDLHLSLFNRRLDIYKYLCPILNTTISNEEIKNKIDYLNEKAWECDTSANVYWLREAIVWNDSWNAGTEKIASWKKEVINLKKLLSESDVEALVKKANASVKQDEKESLYRLAALYGNAEALYQYSLTLGQKGFSRYLLLESAEKGYAQAQIDIGFDCHLPGTEEGDLEARKWFEKAAEQNHPEAFGWLANMAKYGKGGLDPTQADRFRLKAIESGSVDKDLLGWMAQTYEEGNAILKIEPSPEKSVEFLMLLDDDYSRLKIAQAFLAGWGVEKSKGKGLVELKKVQQSTENTDILYELLRTYKSLNYKGAYMQTAQKILELLQIKKNRLKNGFSVDVLLDAMDYDDDYEKMRNGLDEEIEVLTEIIETGKML